MSESMVSDGKTKTLFKGTFNYHGEVYEMYRYAKSKESSFSLFTSYIARVLHLSDSKGIRNYFLTKSASYTIVEEKK